MGLRTSSFLNSRIGPYQVLALLGAGGMGEVYRARDARLGRDVALKVLPPEFTANPDRVARFEREARALAALNHPHIAAIYGVEDVAPADESGAAGFHALVLELVEGETLAERIRSSSSRGTSGIPVDDAIAIARQVADALDAAHEKGIVHRDLKPANIKILTDGVAKVLDFGLAKLVLPAEPPDLSTADSTVTIADRTRDGLILGSAAYMSPEQARGQDIDKRTDIWAFGCVLFEMLTGRVAFAGPTMPDTIAAVLEREPDWGALPEATPFEVQQLLRRCLVKDRRQRLRDIGDARFELETARRPATADHMAMPPITARRRWPVLAAAVGLVAVGAGAALVWTRSQITHQSDPITRATIALPAGHALDTRGGAGPLALTPGGRHIAYVADGGRVPQLYIRSLDAFDPRPIAGTDGAQFPFFSPDGEWVAFFAERKLKRVAVRGGSPITVCDVPEVGHGATWAPDGTIFFDPGNTGLIQVAAGGGTPQKVTSKNEEIDSGNVSWPQILPNGRGLLATLGLPGGADSVIAVLSFDSREWRRLGPGSQAQYLPSGHLLYHAAAVREGELHAVAFDQEALAVHGTPVSVIDTVFRAQSSGAAYFAAAQNGTLIFAPGGYARTLVRVDRNGRRTSLTDDRRGFRHPEISPNGRQVAVTIDPRPSQVWVYDLERRSGIPLSTIGHNLGPLWSPDGRRVTYSSDLDLFARAADASDSAERLLGREGAQYPTSWSSDGKVLLFDDGSAATPNRSDIWMLTREGARALIATPHEERAARLSPDGQWVAYHSDESGRFEVYVRPFPNVNDGKTAVSTAGGRRPVWSQDKDRRELFYAAGSSIMRATVTVRGAAFSAGAPELLFSGPFDLTTTDFSVSPDGNHFFLIESDPNARPTQVQVIFNWSEELSGAVPRSRE
jgi:Tol biopolymer transport system component